MFIRVHLWLHYALLCDHARSHRTASTIGDRHLNLFLRVDRHRSAEVAANCWADPIMGQFGQQVADVDRKRAAAVKLRDTLPAVQTDAIGKVFIVQVARRQTIGGRHPIQSSDRRRVWVDISWRREPPRGRHWPMPSIESRGRFVQRSAVVRVVGRRDHPKALGIGRHVAGQILNHDRMGYVVIKIVVANRAVGGRIDRPLVPPTTLVPERLPHVPTKIGPLAQPTVEVIRKRFGHAHRRRVIGHERRCPGRRRVAGLQVPPRVGERVVTLVVPIVIVAVEVARMAHLHHVALSVIERFSFAIWPIAICLILQFGT